MLSHAVVVATTIIIVLKTPGYMKGPSLECSCYNSSAIGDYLRLPGKTFRAWGGTINTKMIELERAPRFVLKVMLEILSGF